MYIEYEGNRMLFDCGEGTQRQMRIAGLPFMKLDRIFISHFHADHVLGLGGLIQTLDLFQRKKKLEIYGPKGIEDTIDKIITTGHFVLEGFDLEINEVRAKKPTRIYSNGDYSISAVQLDHNVPCLGFSFQEVAKRKFLKKKALRLGVPEGPLFSRLQNGEEVDVNGKLVKPDEVLGKPRQTKKITYVPDTRPCIAGVHLAEGADVLVHDSTFAHDLQESAREGGHSTAKEAAEIAKKAGVKKLAIMHPSQRYKDSKALVKEAKTVFPDTFAPNDFDELIL